MKKSFSIFIVVIMLVMAICPTNVFALEKDINITMPDNIKEITTRHIQDLTIQNENKTDEEKMFEVVIALVDYNERVINYALSEEILNEKEKSKLKSFIKILPEAYKIKIFAWDNENNKNIISNVIDIPIKNGYIEEKIVSIDALNETIAQWSEYTLPETVLANMNTGKQKDVKVKWNIDKVDTTKNGNFCIAGTVLGYANEKVVLNLTISSVIKIVSIDDIEVTIEKDENYLLPKTIVAKLSTGEFKRFSVNWSTDIVDTSVEGKQTVEGTVPGFDGTVKLTVNVVEKGNTEYVEFKNKDLLEIVKEELDIETDKIKKSDLLNLKSLNLSYALYSDSNLDDLKYLKNLEELDISFCSQEFDLRGLSNLINLKSLNLYGNSITDISPLENLINLENLNIISNKIENIEPLKNLTNLKSLKLNSNNIEDLSPVIKFYENLEEKDFEVIFLKADENNTINYHLDLGKEIILPHGIKLSDGNAAFVNWDRQKITAIKVGTETVRGTTDSGNTIIFNCITKEIELEDKMVTFPDEGLEKSIRKAIDKPKGDIYLSDVKNLKQLDAIALGITDLSGIENLHGLEKLGLWGNKINNTQLKHIKGLTNLKYLDLATNELKYIPSKTFDKMPNLIELVLDENQITSIDSDAFIGLENLSNLLIEDNYITNIDCVKTLKNINSLFFRNNNISNLQPIENLTTLKELWADNNKISDITPLSNLKMLEWIELDNNDLSDINALSDCTNIKRLRIGGNKVTDISAVANMLNLEWLEANDNKIANIDGVANLTNLTILNFKNNKITDIEPLRKLVNLSQLYLKGNNITDFSPVADFYYNIKVTDFKLN